MAEDDGWIEPVAHFTGIIPHFWYDAIGQVGPGAFLLGGLYLFGFRSAPVVSLVQDYFITDSGEVHLLPLLGVLALAAYWTGGVFGPFSYRAVQWPYETLSFQWGRLRSGTKKEKRVVAPAPEEIE